MFVFDEPYSEKLTETWEKFIHDETCDCSFMRPEILASWHRSRKALVNPHRAKTTILNRQDLADRLQRNQEMIDIVRPYMEKLFSIVEGSGFYLLLSDRDGYILHIIGDKDIIDHGRNSTMLVVGANRSEDYAGTNAIGTSLALRKPIQIWRGEHYIKPHQQYTCSGAPIFDGDTLLGCLNLTGRFTEVHPHTLGMVISAVDGIQKELQIRKAIREIYEISVQRNSIIESVPNGLILLNNRDEIIQINRVALDMLQFDYDKVIGRNINQMVRIDSFDSEPLSICHHEGEFSDQEENIYYQGINFPPVKVSMSLKHICAPDGSREGTLLRLNRQERIMRLVNKISGYKSTFTFDSIIGNDESVAEMIEMCRRAAKTDANVLLLGESGTGKEMIAQSIHNASEFRDGPFVAINCGALPNGLIESELFGYEKGAFTGANREGNPGKFELADGGTLFLDEIGDMPLNVQVTLLRVLQNKEIMRIGGKYTKKVNVRIIAATNQDLTRSVDEKIFRSDLFYRLNVFSIAIPPLRSRGSDVLLLAEYFLNRFNVSRGRQLAFSADAVNLLYRYDWPGNVRELEGAIERAANITDHHLIEPHHFPDHICAAEQRSSKRTTDFGEDSSAVSPDRFPLPENYREKEKNAILAELSAMGGNVMKTARSLGISRRTLYRKMEKYRIRQSDFR